MKIYIIILLLILTGCTERLETGYCRWNVVGRPVSGFVKIEYQRQVIDFGYGQEFWWEIQNPSIQSLLSTPIYKIVEDTTILPSSLEKCDLNKAIKEAGISR
jgi:hypothetical protein